MKYNGEEIVVVSAVRTPFGKFGGLMKDIDIYDLGSIVMKEAIERVGLSPDVIDEVWWGCGDTTNCKDPYTPVVARQSLIKAGLPASTPSITFDKACVSGMSAVYYAISRIRSGEAHVVLTGGATSFSTVPFLARNLRWSGHRIGGYSLEDPLFPLGYKDFAPVAVDSGNVAVQYNVSRAQQDEFAYNSHQKYGRAYVSGFFRTEMVPIDVTVKKGKTAEVVRLDIDEQYRPNVNLADLEKLPTIFGNPTITAGNAPGMNDGAAAQIVMDRRTAERLGLEPLYTIVGMCSIAANANLLPVAPALAIKKCLNELDISIDEIDVFEINEAFACVPLVSAKLLSCTDFLEEDYKETLTKIDDYPLHTFSESRYKQLLGKLNVNGGAIAVGHANTASGARIMMTAAAELRRRGGGLAACAICGGLTQGDACIIRV
ncbi:thiolase family protein [Sporolituus thermophilus]|uniref:acetyl-CoA C-acetyltransferase n=1 Tax=Sporolituus thermophilus DSM 23256 TaxID=1123285 RepID=A0A1G7HQ59_9FIRM|nr:thiolase family protein [Sporolituus thermophilus]SDF02593.1 acetyl-CoA C-acetyltransferase [Sporolituus thermophilus DSM 23256]